MTNYSRNVTAVRMGTKPAKWDIKDSEGGKTGERGDGRETMW
jgi:hypothetical protein